MTPFHFYLLVSEIEIKLKSPRLYRQLYFVIAEATKIAIFRV